MSGFVIENGWLCEEVGHHTCGTAAGGYYGAHEPGCGREPIAKIDDLLAANVAVYMLRKVADYWDGRPTTIHGDHIYADLLDVLRAIEPTTITADPERAALAEGSDA